MKGILDSPANANALEYGKEQNVAQKPDMQGAAYAVLSAMAIAIAPVVTKQVVAAIGPETFSVLWSLLAFLIASIYVVSKWGFSTFRRLGQCWHLVMATGVMTGVCVLIFSIAVQIADPTLVSFFTRLEAVFTVLLGVLIFKERLSGLELLGVATMISGALVMTYKGGEATLLAFGLGSSVALFTSASTLLSKVVVRYLEPAVLVAVNRLLACLFTLLYTMAFGVLQVPSSTDLLITTVGALFGPFLGFVFLYKALSLSEVSRVSALRTSFPFFVAFYSFLLFHTIPSLRQMLGGGIIVGGILVLISGRHSGWGHTKNSPVSMQ